MRFNSSLSAAAAITIAIALLAAAPTIAGGGAELEAQDAWIRWLPGDLPAAGYLRLVNASAKAVTVVGATSPAYQQVSLHRTVTERGNAQMMPVERITIAAHTALDFAASGYHMMLMQATTPLKPADHVPITLQLADGSSLLVQFELRKPDASQ
jgi:copper(I)-binding protein